MKRLLIPLLAALALPTAVNAETVWLVLMGGGERNLDKIEMKNMKKCEEQGKIFANLGGRSKYNYVCLIGK